MASSGDSIACVRCGQTAVGDASVLKQTGWTELDSAELDSDSNAFLCPDCVNRIGQVKDSKGAVPQREISEDSTRPLRVDGGLTAPGKSADDDEK